MVAVPFDELIMQDIKRFGVCSHLVNMLLTTADDPTKHSSRIGKGGAAVRNGAKDNTPYRARYSFSIRIWKSLAVNDQGLDNQPAHAVSHEYQWPHAEPLIAKLL